MMNEYFNDNGERLINLAASLNLTIANTIFQHKITWTSPDNNTQNQIDNDSRHGSDVMDCRSYRGANIDSDHRIITWSKPLYKRDYQSYQKRQCQGRNI